MMGTIRTSTTAFVSNIYQWKQVIAVIVFASLEPSEDIGIIREPIIVLP